MEDGLVGRRVYDGYKIHPTILFVRGVRSNGIIPRKLYVGYTERVGINSVGRVVSRLNVSSRRLRRTSRRVDRFVRGVRSFSFNSINSVLSPSGTRNTRALPFTDLFNGGTSRGNSAGANGNSGGGGNGGNEGSSPHGFLGGCYGGLATGTGHNRVSTVVNERGRVSHTVRVLYHEAGGGPYLVNRPKMKGATITRNLTVGVTGNRIPTGLTSGRVCLLSLATLITNARFENRFRNEVGNLISRIGDRKGVVLFVSRIRGLINAKSDRNAVGTTGVLGPTLSENRVRIVNTAAFGRCEGCVRGSTTLRHHFRPVGVRRPSIRSTCEVLLNVGTCCRGCRGIRVDSDLICGTMAVSRECVASECLPSGTVSLLSRTYAYTGLHGPTVSRCRLGLGRGGSLLREVSTLSRPSPSRGRRVSCRLVSGLGTRAVGLSKILPSLTRGTGSGRIIRTSLTGIISL